MAHYARPSSSLCSALIKIMFFIRDGRAGGGTGERREETRVARSTNWVEHWSCLLVFWVHMNIWESQTETPTSSGVMLVPKLRGDLYQLESSFSCFPLSKTMIGTPGWDDLKLRLRSLETSRETSPKMLLVVGWFEDLKINPKIK